MSAEPVTLYVLHSNRNEKFVTDTIKSIRWSNADRAHTVYLVVEDKDKYTTCDADKLIQSKNNTDWKFLTGLQHAIRNNVAFTQAVCMRDDAILLGQNFDLWLAKHFYTEKSDLVGVAERSCYVDSFMLVGSNFSSWRVPHEMWDKPPAIHTISTAVFALSARFAKDLFHRRLLPPTNIESWPLPLSCYVTWLCYLFQFNVSICGSMDRPTAPWYINDGYGGFYNVPPYILHPAFLVYHSLSKIAAQNEDDARRWCQQLR